jgi:hypothetical protein
VAATLALAAGGCGGSSKGGTTTSATALAAPTPTVVASGPDVVSIAIGTARAAMHASTHAPIAGRPWPIHFTVTVSGAPARASVSYQYLLAGQVVARRSHYHFDGHFSDVFVWPAAAVGYALTFRAVVETGGSTLNLDYPVKVRR